MLKAIDGFGVSVTIDAAEEGKTYYCPICKQALIQKRGEIREHHFSHIGPKGANKKNYVPCSDKWHYIRAIKTDFCELRYTIEEQSEIQDKIGGMFWGFPEMIKYDSTNKKTWSRLYLYEERYSDKAAACRDLDNIEKINLQSFCDDIFGDG